MVSDKNSDSPPVYSVGNAFNSTLVLTQKNGKEYDSVEDVSDYNPFEHRQVENPNSTKGSLAHLLKSSLGSGILAMPMAFKNSGYLFGAIGTLVVGFICTHCVHILVRTSHEVCRKTKTPSLGFGATAGKVFEVGPHALRSWSNVAKNFGDYGLMATYFSASCVYIIFIASSLQRVLNFELHLTWDVRIYIGFVCALMLCIGQIRVLKYLVPFSMMANFMIVVVFGITLYFILNTPLDFSDKKEFSSWGKLPFFFATVVFAMEGIGAVMPVENQMKHPEKFLGCPGVLNTSMISVVILYTIIGFLGYIRFGEIVEGSVTLNLPMGDIYAEVAQYLIAFAILFTFGLQFYVPNEILWGKVSHKFSEKYHNIAQIGIRSFIIIAMSGICLIVPNLEPFIGLVGAVFFSLLGLFYPAVVETVFVWPHFGRFHWILVKNVLLILIAFLALGTGSWVSIMDIINIYSKGSEE